MTTTIAKFQNIAFPKRENTRKVVISGIFVLAALIGVYVYFVGKIVFDVVGRRQAESSIKSTQSRVGILESKYLAQLQSIDTHSLAALGLSESRDTLYAARTTSTAEANSNPSL